MRENVTGVLLYGAVYASGGDIPAVRRTAASCPQYSCCLLSALGAFDSGNVCYHYTIIQTACNTSSSTVVCGTERYNGSK